MIQFLHHGRRFCTWNFQTNIITFSILKNVYNVIRQLFLTQLFVCDDERQAPGAGLHPVGRHLVPADGVCSFEACTALDDDLHQPLTLGQQVVVTGVLRGDTRLAWVAVVDKNTVVSYNNITFQSALIDNNDSNPYLMG